MMTPDQERWGEASMVLAQHGDEVYTFIAKRIIALAREGIRPGSIGGARSNGV